MTERKYKNMINEFNYFIRKNRWDKNESRSGILDLYKADYETAKATIANLPKQSETIGATYNGNNIDFNLTASSAV